MKHIHIIGGDMRQIFLADMLRADGYTVSMAGFEQLGTPSEKPDSADIVFLPVPYKDKNGHIKAPYATRKFSLGDVVGAYPNSAYVIGRCDSEAGQMLGECVDLLADETFIIDNAVLTAEGAICAYLNASDTALWGAKCVVIGYGRIGKILARLLRSFTRNVTVTARKDKDLALIEAAGLRAVHTADVRQALVDADVIFNTVPHHVLGQHDLTDIPKGADVMELASPPYGVDMDLARQLGVDVRIESGLPGRYFPKSAAAAMLRAFHRSAIGAMRGEEI